MLTSIQKQMLIWLVPVVMADACPNNRKSPNTKLTKPISPEVASQQKQEEISSGVVKNEDQAMPKTTAPEALDLTKDMEIKEEKEEEERYNPQEYKLREPVASAPIVGEEQQQEKGGEPEQVPIEENKENKKPKKTFLPKFLQRKKSK